jgi:predicted kinase
MQSPTGTSGSCPIPIWLRVLGHAGHSRVAPRAVVPGHFRSERYRMVVEPVQARVPKRSETAALVALLRKNGNPDAAWPRAVNSAPMETSAERRYVVVSGPAASGKTTLARRVADEVGVPLLGKDTIKAALFAVLDVHDIETAQLAGRAAVNVLLALAHEVRGCVVLESVWPRAQSVDDLTRLDGQLVEVFCRCDPAVAEARYAARMEERPTGYVSEHRTPAELWTSETTEPVAGGWPVIEVDTTTAVDMAALTSLVREALA